VAAAGASFGCRSLRDDRAASFFLGSNRRGDGLRFGHCGHCTKSTVAPGELDSPLAAALALDERSEQRELFGEAVENALEIALHRARHLPARILGDVARIAQRVELCLPRLPGSRGGSEKK